MCLSQTTGYTVHALACLHAGSGQPRTIHDIADCTGIHKPYLAKILNQLSQRGLVSTKRGYRGGIALSRPPEKITLLEIVEAVEGPKWLGPCLLGLDDCAARRVCPTHNVWASVQRQIIDVLRRTTLADVIECVSQPGKPQHKVRVKGRKPVGQAGAPCCNGACSDQAESRERKEPVRSRRGARAGQVRPPVGLPATV